MTWGKNDDGLAEHPKFRGLSLRAIGLWTICRSWSAHNETDGFLPDDIVREKVGRHSNGTRVALLTQELVDAGLWEVAIGGWMIHDYADWNITKAQKDARRTAAAERQRRHRETEIRRTPDVPQTYSVLTPDVLPPEVPAQSAASQRDRVRKSKRERTEPPTVVHGVVEIPVVRTSQQIIANWIDHYPGKPPSRVLGQLAAEVNKLLLEGYAWDVVNAAVAEWHRRSLHPSALASVLDQMQRPAGTRVGSTVDDRVRNTLAIGERIAARMQEGSVS